MVTPGAWGALALCLLPADAVATERPNPLSTCMMTMPSSAHEPTISLLCPATVSELQAARDILIEYAQSIATPHYLTDFDAELATLPGAYGAPRGQILLAIAQGRVLACCGVLPLDTADYSNACEMRRLYVRPRFRGIGLGRRLVEAQMDFARMQGYSCMLLDALSSMEAARALYEDLGFEEIPPYYFNPMAGAHYLKAVL